MTAQRARTFAERMDAHPNLTGAGIVALAAAGIVAFAYAFRAFCYWLTEVSNGVLWLIMFDLLIIAVVVIITTHRDRNRDR